MMLGRRRRAVPRLTHQSVRKEHSLFPVDTELIPKIAVVRVATRAETSLAGHTIDNALNIAVFADGVVGEPFKGSPLLAHYSPPL